MRSASESKQHVVQAAKMSLDMLACTVEGARNELLSQESSSTALVRASTLRADQTNR